MHKILILSLLIVLLAIPTSAEVRKQDEIAMENDFFAWAIYSFGWECPEVVSTYTAGHFLFDRPQGKYITVIKCKGDFLYILRTSIAGGKGNYPTYTFCHKSVCKEF